MTDPVSSALNRAIRAIVGRYGTTEPFWGALLTQLTEACVVAMEDEDRGEAA